MTAVMIIAVKYVMNLPRKTKEAFRFAKEHWFNGDLSTVIKLKFILCALSPKLYQKIMDASAKN